MCVVSTAIGIFGMALLIIGLLLEGFGAAAMPSRSVRRRIPVSPFSLIDLGFVFFVGGLGINAFANIL